DEVFLSNLDIEATIKKDLGAEPHPTKSQTWNTTDYGEVSKKKITSTVKDRFGGDDVRDSNGSRGVKLSKKRLERLGKNYSSINGIKWDRNPIDTTKTNKSETFRHFDTFDTSIEGVTSVETEKVGETSNNYNTASENIQQMPSNNENISSQ